MYRYRSITQYIYEHKTSELCGNLRLLTNINTTIFIYIETNIWLFSSLVVIHLAPKTN